MREEYNEKSFMENWILAYKPNREVVVELQSEVLDFDFEKRCNQ